MNNLVKIAVIVTDIPALEGDDDCLRFGADAGDAADVAIEDSLVIIVFDLHDLVLNPKIPSTSKNPALPRVERLLELGVEVFRTVPAWP